MERISVVVLLTSIVLMSSVDSAHKGEGCFGISQCYDTGLTCSGARCYCLMDLSPAYARYWACNDDEDCSKDSAAREPRPAVAEAPDCQNSIAACPPSIAGTKNQQPAVVPVQHAMVQGMECKPSTECPASPGFSGYCNIGR
ncbi:hypothetical protein BV898_08673 [Hypsibius exemplaris]|uniref:EB domain-containing protein n=1 Tax=Hypsibius exemplaris TaxID=2072580 RepID=A0A1W0WPZ1_HYPEX|nr:hypothetical protein BV898_08673 [Hypsibius exemplaris]